MRSKADETFVIIVKSCCSELGGAAALKPNCADVKMLFLWINILILFSKLFSHNLENTDGREIGLNSFSD